MLISLFLLVGPYSDGWRGRVAARKVAPRPRSPGSALFSPTARLPDSINTILFYYYSTFYSCFVFCFLVSFPFSMASFASLIGPRFSSASFARRLWSWAIRSASVVNSTTSSKERTFLFLCALTFGNLSSLSDFGWSLSFLGGVSPRGLVDTSPRRLFFSWPISSSTSLSALRLSEVNI